jgi:hypothetical protein
MATIAEIRAQYPQYSDMSDAALADALYKKFYSDMPRADFDAKVGLQPSPAPRSEGMPTAPRQELTSGQRMYQSIRPYVAPTIEALGSAGGALLGAPLGPPGVVGGAGLGYGIAKEALELGDVYLGGKEPRQGSAIALEPAKNVLEGGTYESGGRVVGPLLGKTFGKVVDFKNLPQNKAASVARQSLGADLEQTLEILRNAPPNASVAEITAKIQNPTWQALVKNSLEQSQSGAQYLNKFATMSHDEGVNALAKLAGGATATDVRATTDLMKQTLRDITSPARQAALNRANLGQQVAQYEAEAGKLSAEAAAKVQEVRRLIDLGDHAAAAARLQEIKAGIPAGSRFAPAKVQPGYSNTWAATFTYPGKLAQMSDEWASRAAEASLDLGQGARFAQSAADSLRAAGIKPLKGDEIVGQIRGVLNNPEFAGNDLLSGAAKNVANDIAQWTKNGGIIDARALDAIRKNSINAAVQQLRPGVDATTQRNLAAKVTSELKPTLINAIEAAGGKGYREYLDEFSKGMQKIAETKLTGEAARLWKTDKDAFVRLVQNEAPDVVEKFLGPGNYNIATELSENTISTLQSLASKRANQLASSKQASDGQKALATLLEENTSKFRLPSLLNFWATATNKTLAELQTAIGSKSMKILADAMQSPQGAKNLLEKLPAQERNNVLKIISDPSSFKNKAAQRAAGFIRSGATTTSINALASEPSENALID